MSSSPLPWDRIKFHDYVVEHGYGPPTVEGYVIGERLITSGLGDYAVASAAVAFEGYTEPPGEELPPIAGIVAKAEDAFDRKDYDEADRLFEMALLQINRVLVAMRTARKFLSEHMAHIPVPDKESK
jgi:hypothetical protein